MVKRALAGAVAGVVIAACGGSATPDASVATVDASSAIAAVTHGTIDARPTMPDAHSTTIDGHVAAIDAVVATIDAHVASFDARPSTPDATTFTGPVAMFSTITSNGGNLGGRAGADTLCSAAMTDQSLTAMCPNQVHAFLSVTADDSIAAMPAKYGVPTSSVVVSAYEPADVAQSWADLLDGSIGFSLENAVITDAMHYTGSTAAGALIAGSNCNGWTSNSQNDNGTIGSYTATNSDWMDFSTFHCEANASILCICY